MNKELTNGKYSFVVMTKNRGKYYITQEQRDRIHAAIVSGDKEFDTLIFTEDGGAFNLRMVSEIMTLRQAIEHENLEKGMYQCAAGEWHARNDKCEDPIACFHRAHPQYNQDLKNIDKKLEEVQKQCGRCVKGKLLIENEYGVPVASEKCSCSKDLFNEKEEIMIDLNDHLEHFNLV
jgi:hypothetical protein